MLEILGLMVLVMIQTVTALAMVVVITIVATAIVLADLTINGLAYLHLIPKRWAEPEDNSHDNT